MSNDKLNHFLSSLKEDIESNPLKLQPCIDRNILNINNAINYGYTVLQIYNFLFEENKKSSLGYFSTMLVRARKKKGKEIILENKIISNTEDNQQTIGVQKTENKTTLNKPKKEEEYHDSRSDLSVVLNRADRVRKKSKN